MSTHGGTRRRRTAWSITTTVVAWLVIVAIVAALLAAVAVPRVLGATPYTILTGSMRPMMPPGTLVVVEPVDIDELAVGDVITYQLESGKSPVVTHRVIAVTSTLGGQRTVTTQGDANTAPDAAPVAAEQVRGKVSYTVPYLGRVNTLFSGSQRQSAMTVVAVGLFLYALFMVTGAAVDRRRRPRSSEPATTRTTVSTERSLSA